MSVICNDTVVRVYYATRLTDHLSLEEMEAMWATLGELKQNLASPSPSYWAKQLHPVPDFPVVDREQLILEYCTGRLVLDIGASGRLHEKLQQVASDYIGISASPAERVIGMDLDDVTLALPKYWGVQVVVCGEVLEHLSNPGFFLKRLRDYSCTTIFSVPNALSATAQNWMRRSLENVNSDHVAWYSHKTLHTLLARYDYVANEWYWYGGQPRFAEGLIAVCHARGA